MQINAIHKCAPGNKYQLQTLASLALKKIPADTAAAPSPAMTTPPKVKRTGANAAKPAGLSIGTSDPFDQWWDQAGQVMSPVRQAPPDGAHAQANHEDTDDEAEEIDSDAEEMGASLSSKGGIASTPRRGKSFRTNAALDDDDFFAKRGTPKPARHGDKASAAAAHEWDPNADWFGEEGSGSGSSAAAAEGAPFGGASASNSAQDGGADVSVKAVKDAGAKPSTVRMPSATAVEEEHKDECEGLLYMRVSGALFSHQWRPRYVVLHKGVVHVYRDRYSRIHYPEEQLEEVHLSESMALSGMKVAAASTTHPRVFYRHIAALESGGLFGENQQADQNQPGQRRVFKYGADSPDEFENWSTSFKAAIDRLRRRKARQQQDQMELEGAISSSDAFADAIRSPRSRPHRRATGVKNQLKEILGMQRVDGEQLSGTADVTLAIHLLDGSKFNVLVHAGGTVRDALVSLRERLALTSDADFSLFLRDHIGGKEHFTVIPDISTAEEAEATAARDSRDLVYMRRMYLPPSEEEKAPAGGVGAAAGGSGAPTMHRADSKGVVPIDLEAANATDKGTAAHRLLYIEAVYHVTKGNYMVTPQGAVLLAALQCVSHPAIGPFDESKHGDGTVYSRHVQELFSASVMAQWVHSHETSEAGTEGVPGLLEALQTAHKAAGGKSELGAQKEYVRKVAEVEEYGSTFFHATLLRHPAETGFAHGSKSVPDTPQWARDVTTAEHARDTDIERLPVLVAMNHKGIWTRPAPVYHVAGENFARYTGELASLGGVSQASGSGSNTTAALQRMHAHAEGNVVPWALHQVQYVEVWGVKKLRPVFTYRVRERQLTVVEVQTAQYKECASVLHSYVFALLARKEGKSRDNARSNALDYGASALAAKAALKAAKSQAGIERDAGGSLPPNWSEIRDPVTGSTAYWNSQTKQTVWAKPTA